MNKKVKSLLAGGLLVVGMSGNVFALKPNKYYGNDGKGQCEHTGSKLDNVDTLEGGKSYEIEGVIRITLSGDKKYAKVEPIKDENGYDLVKINAIHVKGADAYNCYVLGDGETWAQNLSSPLKNGKIPEISHITVDYTAVPEENRPKPEGKGTGTEEPKDPSTGGSEKPMGDTSIMPMATVAVASAAALVVLNKKDEE